LNNRFRSRSRFRTIANRNIFLQSLYATGSRRKAFFCSFLSGVSGPVGALIGCAILFRFFNDFVFGVSFTGEEVGVAASFLSDIGHLASRYVPSFDLAAKAEKER
jgi:hypothetical protein